MTSKKNNEKKTVSKQVKTDKNGKQTEDKKRTVQDYKSGVKPVWCPGCGHYGALSAFYKGLVTNEINPKDLTLVSGIGCSGRFSHFVRGYCFHVLHGRVLPTCQGIAASAKPGVVVCGISGDGDALAIGGGHLPHTARRNPNMVYIILDNSIYGLTKGQFSPTTRHGMNTATSPYGVTEKRLDPLSLLLAYDASFVARGFSANNKQLANIMARAIKHRGFSVVHVLSPCVTFNKEITYDFLSQNTKELPDDYDETNKVDAFKYAQDPSSIYTGVFYHENRPTMQEYHDEAIKTAKKDPNAGDLEYLINNFR